MESPLDRTINLALESLSNQTEIDLRGEHSILLFRNWLTNLLRTYDKLALQCITVKGGIHGSIEREVPAHAEASDAESGESHRANTGQGAPSAEADS
jgi:hypothetical protein